MAKQLMLGCPIISLLYLELAYYFEFNFIKIYPSLMLYFLIDAARLLIRSSMIDDAAMLIAAHEARLIFQSMNQKLMVKLVVLQVLDLITKDQVKVPRCLAFCLGFC